VKINKLILVCICLMTLTTVGCGNKDNKNERIENKNEIEQSQEPINNGKDYLLVYYKDKQGESLLAKKIAVNKITGNSIVSELSRMGVMGKEIKLNSCKEKKEEDKVFLALDFNQDFQTQFDVWEMSGERLMVGCVVNTFLSAYQYDSVGITINGKPLKSGHAEYEGLLQKYALGQEPIVVEEVDYHGEKITIVGKKQCSEMGFSTIYVPDHYRYQYDADAEVATIRLKKDITTETAYFAFSKSKYSVNDTVSGLQLQSSIPLSLENVQIGQKSVLGIRLSGEQNDIYQSFYVLEYQRQVYILETHYEGMLPDSYLPIFLAMIKQFAFV